MRALVFLAAALHAQPPDLREAARLDQAGDCAGAEAIYQKGLAAPKPSAALLNNAGLHYVVCGEPGKARALFERLLAVNPGHANANLQLGAIYAGEGQFAKAEAAFQRAVAARPGDFEALFHLGRAAARAGHYTRAREALEAAQRLRPEDPGVLLELGLAHAAAQDYTRAVFLLAQAQSKQPRHPGIALALARAAEDAGFYGDAVLAYQHYLELKPEDDTARRDRARVLGHIRPEDGLKEMAAYIERHPSDPTGHFNLAQFTWRDDAPRSLELLATAVRLDAKYAPAHVARAWLLSRLGRDTEALAHLEAALRVTPEDPRALDQLGLVQLALDQPAKAEAALRKAAALAPQDAAIALHLGRALMALDREAEARQWLDKHQRLKPQRQRDPRREPGMIESATLPAAERRAREIERFGAMARARPDDPLLEFHLGELLLADGRSGEAMATFRRLLGMNGDAALWSRAGRALVGAGHYELAREFLERSAAGTDLALALLHTAGPAAALEAIEKTPAAERDADFFLLEARLLDAAGRAEQASEVLARGLRQAGPARPGVVREAALMLARQRRYADAEKLLAAAGAGDAELEFTRAMVTALAGRTAEAMTLLRRIESRWPEWDRPNVAEGLLLEAAGRKAEAAQRFRTAAALGSPARPPAGCQLYNWLFADCRAKP